MALLTGLVLAQALITAPRVAATTAEGTSVGGTLTTDTIWTEAGSPYLVSSQVVIPAGITLTVEPGVTVVNQITTSPPSVFSVAGTLHAHGTSTERISFDSNQYPPLLGGPAAKTIADATGVVEMSWTDITNRYLLEPSSFTRGGDALARLSLIDSKVNQLNQGITLTGVRNVELVRNSFVLGVNSESRIVLGPGRESTVITHNRFRSTFLDCTGGSLTLRANTFEPFWYDELFANYGGSGIRVSADCSVDARDNDWGTEGSLDERIRDGNDTLGLPIVDVSTRLDGPAAGTPTLNPGRLGDWLTVLISEEGVQAWAREPAHDGGLPTTYLWEAIPVGTTVPEQTVTGGAYALFRYLDPTKTYFLRVTAENADGTSNSVVKDGIQPVPTADAVMSFQQDARTVGENAGTVQLTVIRSGATLIPATVNYERSSGSATPGTDFTLEPGTLYFAAGETTSSIPVTITSDPAPEAPETIRVALSDPSSGAVLGSPDSMTLMIAASDQRPDGWISTARTSGYVGNNLYNTTGDGQTKTLAAQRTVTRTFFARVYNDGNVNNTIAIKGSTPRAGSTVRYYSGTTDITTAMRSPAGWKAELSRGAYTLITVKIKVLPTATFGSLKPATVSAAWTGDGTRTDLVKAVVKVVR